MAGYALDGIVNGGIGKHAADIPLREAAVAFQAWFISEMIYGPLSAMIRTSIALLLLRLSPSKVQRWILYTCLAIVYIFTVVYFFINLLQCSPPSYFWKQFQDFDMKGSCDNPNLLPNAAIAHSVIAAASDLVIAILSAWAIKQNFMSSRTRTMPSQDSCQSTFEDELQHEKRMKKTVTIMAQLRQNKTKIVIMLFLALGSA